MSEHINPNSIKPLDLEKRKIHFERRQQDEAEALSCIIEAQKVYKCFLMPSFETGVLQMMVHTHEPDTPETRANLDAFGAYLQQVLEQYQVQFTPIVSADDPSKSGVYLLTTW